MGIKNNLLNDTASLFNAGTVLTHTAFSEEVQDTGASITTFTDEIGDRISNSRAVTNNVVTLISTRTAGDVVDTVDGDTIKSIGMFNQSSGGTVRMLRNPPDIVHTINFDLETRLDLTFSRRT